jgi:hypothetical protein
MATGTSYVCPLRIRFLGDSFPEAREILAGVLAGDDVGAWSAAGPAGPSGTADVLIPALRRVDGPVMDAVRPALIQQFGAGLDGVDLEAATARRIPVAKVPGDQTGGAGSVAELAVLHLLALSRRLDQARARLRDGLFGEPVSRGLAGQTATVIGLGAIGREVLIRLRPFGVRLVGVGRRPRAKADADAVALVDEYRPLSELHTALEATGLLVLCLPLTASTRGLIGAAELGPATRRPSSWPTSSRRKSADATVYPSLASTPGQCQAAIGRARLRWRFPTIQPGWAELATRLVMLAVRMGRPPEDGRAGGPFPDRS